MEKQQTPWQEKLQKAITSPRQAERYWKVFSRYAYLNTTMRTYSVRNGEAAALKHARELHEKEYQNQSTPLVSVTIATYNRGQLLEERPLTSILNQTYTNFEVIVVGDGCTDDTGERIARLNDPRIRYINLPERSKYPEDPQYRWMVAGTPPVNRAMAEARGSWIAHLDDDEIFESNHLKSLVEFSAENDAEFIYSRVTKELEPNVWVDAGEYPVLGPYWTKHNIPHSTILFRHYLALFQFDINSWKMNLPVDFQMWVRMYLAGVKFGFLNQVTTIAPLRPETSTYSHLAEDRV